MTVTVTSLERNLAGGGSPSQSQVLWSYGPALAVDGREETCSYTTSGQGGEAGEGREGRWWRLGLASLTSVGQVRLTLAKAGAGQQQEVQVEVQVYLLAGQEVRHCHPLQGAVGDNQGDSDRRRLVTDCSGESSGDI